MAIAALSPNSVSASPIQVNPQVKTDLQISAPQVAQDAQKAVKSTQTDTVTISSQALKMADEKSIEAKKTANKANEQEALQLAHDKTVALQNETQKNAEKAYAIVSANQ